MRKILIFSVSVFFMLSGILSADEGISGAIRKFAENQKRMRIAVFDFVNTSGEKTQYDEYIADSIVSEIGKYPLTLLERKRIEMILNESALSQSGLVDADKAMKLGTLLPVDVIVSGSYTRIDGKIAVNGRFIHVTTGEIIYTFTASIEDSGTGKEGKETADEKSECAEVKAVKSAMLDLKDKASVDRAVAPAVKIPFEGECGKIHYEVMYTFAKYKIFSDAYRMFLTGTLSSVEDPSNDHRPVEIMRYFAADERIDDTEWNAGLDVVKRSKPVYPVSVLLRLMLNNTREKDSLVRERADGIMRLASEGRIGRPVPAEEDAVFFDVLTALASGNKKENISNTLYFFNKYRGLVPDNDEKNKRALEVLKSMYFTECEAVRHNEARSVLLDFYRSRSTSEFLAESAADLIRSVENKSDDRYEHDKEKKKIYSDDLIIMNKSMEELYCVSVGYSAKKGYRYIVEERAVYILKNKMICSNTPSIKDLEEDMRSGGWEKKLKAAELLSKIGSAAKDAEKTLIKYLGQQGFGYNGGRLRHFCAAALGNIKTLDPQGIEMLIESFPDFENGVSYEAEEAIRKIGQGAMPYLIKGLGHREHAVRLRCAKALGNLGNKAKEALPSLERLAVKDEDPYVRKEAKGAVQMISNDY